MFSYETYYLALIIFIVIFFVMFFYRKCSFLALKLYLFMQNDIDGDKTDGQ